MANGALDEALVVAREVMSDFPPERYYDWRYAWPLLMFTSVERNAEEEDLAFVEQHMPGFLDLDTLQVHGQVNTMRYNSMDVLAATKSEEELRQFAARVTAHYQKIGFREDDLPHVNLEGYVLRGEIEEGIQWALDKVFPMSPPLCPWEHPRLSGMSRAPYPSWDTIRRQPTTWCPLFR